MSILEYNGSAIVAMTGKNCVSIACDKRLGTQNVTVACNFQKIFNFNSNVQNNNNQQQTGKCLVGLAGLATDVQTLAQLFKQKSSLYKLQEERIMSAQTTANLISSTLYERRFGPYFIEPVIAGLDSNNRPYICSMDVIGCKCEPKDFVVSGVAADALNGLCETLWEPDMSPDELFETTSQVLLSALDRDCLSGWGAVVYIM